MNSKICTSIEQSKKLVEILPNESADCHYITQGEKLYFYSYSLSSDAIKHYDEEIKYIPCWSLVALLDVLPDELGDDSFLTLQKEKNEYCCCYEDINGNSFRHTFADNPVDACVAMIEKLHELKIL